MTDLLIKGKGVFYRDADGKMHPMTLPPKESDHKNLSHFYINSKTGRAFEEIDPSRRQWPMDKAASILAADIMSKGYVDENGVRRKPTSAGAALRMAKESINRSTVAFNRKKRDAGDDFHTLRIPFDEGGALHPEYKQNHYGPYQPSSVKADQRQTRSEDGRLYTNHTNNRSHPEYGIILESAAIPQMNELREESKKRGFETQIGGKVHGLDHHQMTDNVTYRYTSNDRDPRSEGNTLYPGHYRDLHAQSSAYGRISPMDVVSVLPNDFFVPSTSGGMSSAIMRDLMDMGYSQTRARQMARAPVNQLLFGRGKDGAATGLRKVMSNMREQLGIDSNDDIKDRFHTHQSHFAAEIRGGDRGRNRAAIEIMAMLKTAEEQGIDPNSFSMFQSPPRQVVDGWRAVAQASGGQTLDLSALGIADERHAMRDQMDRNTDHAFDVFPEHLSGGAPAAQAQPPEAIVEEPLSAQPLAEQLLPPSITDDDPYVDPYFDPFYDESTFQASDDDPMGVIATIMERVQMHDAGGSLVRKYDPMNATDMRELGDEVGLTGTDVRAIAMSLGDWGIIAKQFKTSLDVVRSVKVNSGGAIRG